MVITEFEISFEKHEKHKYPKNRKEIVSFGFESLKYELGEISLKISSIPDSKIIILLQHFRNKMELLKDNDCIEMSEMGGNKTIKPSAIKGAVECFFQELVTRYEHKNNSQINELLFLFPLAELLIQYRIDYGYKSIAERDPNYSIRFLPPKERAKALLTESINDIKNPQSLLRDALNKKNSPISNAEKTYRALDYIACRGLSKELISDLEFLNSDNVMEYYQAALGYCEIIISNLKEIMRIKSRLKEFIDSRHNNKFGADHLPQWILREIEQLHEPERGLALISIVALEQKELYDRKLYIRVCPLCKRTFLTYNHSNKYCANPNPIFSDRTCQEVGNDMGPAFSMELYPLLNSKRKSYCNWIKKQHRQHPEIFTSKNAQNIENEIKTTYESWHTKARTAVYLYENRQIEIEEAEFQINLPEIEYRSPLLYKRTHK